MSRGRGGSREGTPGTPYPNRADLRAPKPPPIVRFQGQPQGAQAEQVRQQQQAPDVGAATVPPTPVAAPTPPPPTSIDAPTTRPWEPSTAGLPYGPGPGPEALGAGSNDTLSLLRAAAQVDPNNDILRLILDLEAGQ